MDNKRNDKFCFRFYCKSVFADQTYQLMCILRWSRKSKITLQVTDKGSNILEFVHHPVVLLVSPSIGIF